MQTSIWCGDVDAAKAPVTTSNPLPVKNSTSVTTQALITSQQFTINSTSTTITLLAPSTIINFINPSVDMYLNLGTGPAIAGSNGSLYLPAGSGFRYVGGPALQQFTMITGSGSGSVSIQGN